MKANELMIGDWVKIRLWNNYEKITAIYANGVVAGLIGSIFDKEKLCGIAAITFFVEFFLLIAFAMIFIWI